MSEVCCKRCGASDHVKNGIVRGLQRYRCLSCGCNFTMTPPRGKPPAMKTLAPKKPQFSGLSLVRTLQDNDANAYVIEIELELLIKRRKNRFSKWRARRGSNSQPSVSKTDTLSS